LIFSKTPRTITVQYRIADHKAQSIPREIALALKGQRAGADSYLCHCPGPMHRHGDVNPSLSVKVSDRGRLLLHCFAGCDYVDIVAALRAKGIRL
jgi:putative DNA primase/helicase